MPNVAICGSELEHRLRSVRCYENLTRNRYQTTDKTWTQFWTEFWTGLDQLICNTEFFPARPGTRVHELLAGVVDLLLHLLNLA